MALTLIVLLVPSADQHDTMQIKMTYLIENEGRQTSNTILMSALSSSNKDKIINGLIIKLDIKCPNVEEV